MNSPFEVEDSMWRMKKEMSGAIRIWVTSDKRVCRRRESDVRYAAPLFGMTGSDSQAWVMLRIGRQAVQSHKRREPVDEENKVCRFGCPCRDDFGSRGGAGRGD